MPRWYRQCLYATSHWIGLGRHLGLTAKPAMRDKTEILAAALVAVAAILGR